jgi:hypothetical protein
VRREDRYPGRIGPLQCIDRICLGPTGTVRLWDGSSGPYLRTLRSDRRHERLDVTGLTGVTAAQRAALLALGAVEQYDPQSEPGNC